MATPGIISRTIMPDPALTDGTKTVSAAFPILDSASVSHSLFGTNTTQF
jgi:hypothetical protein